MNKRVLSLTLLLACFSLVMQAEGRIVECGIHRAALFFGQSDALDSQRPGQPVLGQLEGDPSHAIRLARDGFKLERPRGIS